ncbi:hypothetical protein [Halorubrum sp. N11]|uniref:hypothetical protein n=1 Tax=Halorubrum sp. N11 TaxID=3402276 RepID=UPI003EBBF6F7
MSTDQRYDDEERETPPPNQGGGQNGVDDAKLSFNSNIWKGGIAISGLAASGALIYLFGMVVIAAVLVSLTVVAVAYLKYKYSGS